MRAAILLCATALAACGTSTPASRPLDNQPPPAAATRVDRATEALRALSSALRHDQPLDGLVDPVDGLWLWDQPGVAVTPSVHVAPGDHRRPSEIVAASGWPPGVQARWATAMADAIDRGLAHLDVDGDPTRPVYYVDCGTPEMAEPARALLRTHGFDIRHDYSALADSPAAGVTAPLGFYLLTGSAAVYLSERGDRLAVAHLLDWTPCDA